MGDSRAITEVRVQQGDSWGEEALPEPADPITEIPAAILKGDKWSVAEVRGFPGKAARPLW